MSDMVIAKCAARLLRLTPRFSVAPWSPNIGALEQVIQIADAIPKFASNSRVAGTTEENKAVVQGSLSLFGTYTVDEAAKMLIYNVESSTFPNWVGQEQKRPIDSVTADELRHSNLAGSIAGATTVNIWKRSK
jgi:hypothetical protein